MNKAKEKLTSTAKARSSRIMAKVYTGVFSGMLGPAGCIGGYVYDHNGDPIANVTVLGRTCPTCSIQVANTNSEGLWAFDYNNGGYDMRPTNGEEASEFLVCKGTLNGPNQCYTTYHTPNMVAYPDGSGDYGSEASPVLMADLVNSQIDTDDDGLPDQIEYVGGLNGSEKDSDGDGISDYAEVYGWNWIDYPGYGADPRHKDVFVEVDYEEYTDASNVVHSWKLSDTEITWLQGVYAALDVTNPDGTLGINLHFVNDTKLPQGLNCNDQGNSTSTYTDPSAWAYCDTSTNVNVCRQYKRQDGFRFLTLCSRSSSYGGQTSTGVSGEKVVAVRSIEDNRNPADDATEATRFFRAAIVAHELGHALGLGHGGFESMNWKPNYPSLMNYSYDYDLNGSASTLQSTQIRFSAGTWPPIDEVNGVVETNWAPSGTTPTFLTSCDRNAFTVNGRNVNWNKDGDYNDIVTGKLRIRDGMSSNNGVPPDGSTVLLLDNDDAASLDTTLDANIPGDGPSGVVEVNPVHGRQQPKFQTRDEWMQWMVEDVLVVTPDPANVKQQRRLQIIGQKHAEYWRLYNVDLDELSECEK